MADQIAHQHVDQIGIRIKAVRHDRRYWFVFVVPVFGAWMALDFVSNAAMLILCGIGYRAGPPISFPPR